MTMKSINNINLKFKHFFCIQCRVLGIQSVVESLLSLVALLRLLTFPCAVDPVLDVSPDRDVVLRTSLVIGLSLKLQVRVVLRDAQMSSILGLVQLGVNLAKALFYRTLMKW